MAGAEIYDDVRQAVAEGDQEWACDLMQKGIEAGRSPIELIDNGLTPALRSVGDRWDAGEIFLPQMILAAEAMKAAMAVLQPELQKSHKGEDRRKSCVMGTVKGDIHDIGKSIVGALAEAGGLLVHDLGTNVDTKRFVETVQETGACIVGLSALLTTTMAEMKVVLDALKEAGLRDQVSVVVGGAPVTQAFADQIGADGYAEDGLAAMRMIQSIAGQDQAA